MRKSAAKMISLSTMVLVVLLAGLGLAARTSGRSKTADQHEQHEAKPAVARAIAVLRPTDGSKVSGIVTFTREGDKVKVVAQIEGLTPGKHGFHIHEWGDCSSKDGSAAGGHFNPAGAPHGAPTDAKHHAGDLGNLEAGQDGMAHLEHLDSVLKFDGPNSIIGRGLIVHANPDDLKTQPTGNAGGRLACGAIGLAK